MSDKLKSLIHLFGSKYRIARWLRFYHKHVSPKAKAKKKSKRRMVKESRRRNRGK